MSDNNTESVLTESLFNLSQAIFDKIEGLGVAEAAKLFRVTQTAVKKWQAGTAEPGVTACQIVLDEAMASGSVEVDAFTKPPEQGLTRPEAAPVTAEQRATSEGDGHEEKMTLPEPAKQPPGARKVSFCTPVNRDMSFAVVLSMLGNWKSTLAEELRGQLAVMDFEPDTLVHRGRNILATRFLASGNEWSIWLDSDIIAPIGNANWFRRRTGAKFGDQWLAKSAFETLTRRGKTLIGGVYAERNQSGRLVTQPGLSPTGDGDKKLTDEIKREGPQDKVVPVGWLGFGCVAVHRKVFEDILKTQPDVASKIEGEPHGFFTAIENGPQGEDVAFCKRAANAGHPSFLDLSVFCGHVGKFSFMP